MNNWTDRIIDFFKEETIFAISLALAIVSCFFVLPSSNYLNYINWETILLLFLIMLIVELLKNFSVFEILVRKLLLKVQSTRGLVFILIFTCFFSSIFLTNDVSLIIFVPFTLLVLKKIDRLDLAIFSVSIQIIAANVGCMVLPIGAPHNIVMYTVSHIPFLSFFMVLLPYIIVSTVFLFLLLFLVPNDNVNLQNFEKIDFDRSNLFKKAIMGVDYYLLLTFIALFILIGNLQNIPLFNSLFAKFIIGNEVLWGALASQIISNVPAAILLSGFSTNFEAIIVGINIGGFGTLIASMANVISYKIIIREHAEFKMRYLIVFTVLNLILLILLLGVYTLFN